MLGENSLSKYLKICEFYHGETFLSLGPDRWTFVVAFLVVNIVEAIILYILSSKESDQTTFFLIHCVALIFLDVSWLATAFINPGFLQKDENEDLICQFCNNPNSEAIYSNPLHCLQCQVCIQQRSHHCKLTGNCIGKGNKIVYYFMLLSVLIYILTLASTLPYIYYLF